jgi:hypothetical protein
LLQGCISMAAELVQIIYDDKQKVHCFPFSKLHYNESLTIYFENEIIARLVMASKADKIGVCSWKLKEKLRWYIGQRRELTQELLETDYEVMTFTKNTKYHKFYQAADAWHPGFLVAFDKIIAKIGVTRPWEIKIPIYQNAFSARTDIYRDYVTTYLKPAMEVMTNDPEINKIVMQDSKYSDLTNQSADHLENKIGIRYYPLAPFILERLFSTYVHNRRINCTPL